jgi:hypothetical protein
MDDLYEENIVKKSFQLHSDLSRYIGNLTQLVTQSNDETTKDVREKSNLIFLKLTSIICEFESSPLSLDIYLSTYIDGLSNLFLSLNTDGSYPFVCIGIGELIYQFSKIRGFKIITNYFSSDVYLVPKLIELIQHLSNDNEVFLCLIWLCNLVLVPFRFEDVDPSLISQLYDVGVVNLTKHTNASKNQLASLILLSRFLSRPDILQTDFMDRYFIELDNEWKALDKVNGSLKLGHLMTTNKILKRCPIEKCTKYVSLIYDLIKIDLINLRYQQENNKHDLSNLNILYMIKILSKISTIYMKQGNYILISKIIDQLLNDIMNLMINKFDTKLRYAMAKALSILNQDLSLHAVNYQEQLITYLIDHLQIPDLKISYSPYIYSDSVTNNFMEITIESDEISIPKYHTILLFLGYSCLNRSIPKHLVPTILSIVNKTLFIEQRRLHTVLGSQLRDSSCFILWAICRLLTQEDFKNYLIKNKFMMESILFDLILVIITDTDLVIRRCGIAVIQEFIGRFGTLLFSQHIIDKEKLGEFIIRFIELFNNSTIGSNIQSYELIGNLVNLGFDKNLFVPVLITNILDRYNSFEIIKLNSITLKRLLQAVTPVPMDFRLQNTPLKQYDIDTVLETLSSDSLYSMCELLLIEPQPENTTQFKTISQEIKRFSFDYHYDSIDKAEGFMKWINFLVDNKYEIDEYWSTLFSIMRVQDSSSLSQEFIYLFQNLTHKIGRENIDQLQYFLENSNMILSISVFYYPFEIEEIHKFFAIIENTNVDADTRANLINCLAVNFNSFDMDILCRLVALMDDYTTTNQGDVGFKIRFATIQLIQKNLIKFKNLYKLIHPTTIRLAGELIDKIRIASFKLMLDMENLDWNETKINQMGISDYFKSLFQYYHHHIFQNYEHSEYFKDLSRQFWKGVAFTLGALTANSQVVNAAFLEMVSYMLTLTTNQQQIIYQNLITLLKLSSKPSGRDLKSYVMVLNVFVKVFESNMCLPDGFNFEALFIRCYNLHIGTKNVIRIGMVVKVFEHLSLHQLTPPDINIKSRNRLVWLCCNHNMSKIRIMASEALFEIINEANPDSDIIKLLDDIDWDMKPLELRKYSHQLEKAIENN